MGSLNFKSATEIYKMVLQGKNIKIFPRGFWLRPEALENAGECTRFLLEVILQYNDDEIKRKTSLELFKKYKLGGMAAIVFDCSPFKIIDNAYPGRFREWELPVVPISFWDNIENKKSAVKWLIEEKLQWDDDEVKSKLTVETFKSNGLNTLITGHFKNIHEALELAYPGRFKPWQLQTTMYYYWEDKTNVLNAFEWMVYEELRWSDDDILKYLCMDTFRKYDLDNLLIGHFNSSIFKLLDYLYPGKFNKKKFVSATHHSSWPTKESGIRAIKDLICEKLKLTDDEIKEQICVQFFIDNGLKGVLSKWFNGSPYQAMEATFPNKFHPWEFKFVPDKFWQNTGNGVKALKWLIEKKLKFNDVQIKKYYSGKLIRDNGLGGMLEICFNSSPYQALEATYPGRFKVWELKSVPRGYWSDINNGIEAMRWLIEEKLKLTDSEVEKSLNMQMIKDNGLRGMLNQCYNNSINKALESAYPGKFKRSKRSDNNIKRAPSDY